jgi:hypothetical protein
VFLSEAPRLFDEDGRLADAATREQIEALMQAFAAWIDAVAPGTALGPVPPSISPADGEPSPAAGGRDGR